MTPRLMAGDDLDGEVLTGDLSGQDAGSARFLECRFEECDLTELRAPRARFAETTLYAVRGAGVDLAESQWLDCVVTGARLGAVQLFGAELRRVRFEGGKVDFLNLRGATLREVAFTDCVLTEPDFGGATLEQVTFEGCRLVAPDFNQARMKKVDLSGAQLSAPRGLASLSGATISRLQLFDLAPNLADQLGITVAD
ncbi:pentapeptide repeat-containing protein [Phycicoccus sp. SLBN-51]|uniref:pentapeptide repeat-containing protein n=1 Tax=Phycicoccus sp. SLBN-51 TaxID=2768447 RepID=UPI0011517563|nr:pentapeptide repeat-containing protein [Phycicoccus sp. SLBN-51]